MNSNIFEARLKNFFIEMGKGDQLSFQLFSEELAKGKSIDTIIRESRKERSFLGSDFGYSLEIDDLDTDIFLVKFSLVAGPMAGDGGEWKVLFQGDDVVSIETLDFFIA